MKTEIKIAEENLNHAQMNGFVKDMCQSHKASCQRFLKFLESSDSSILPSSSIMDGGHWRGIDDKITDLKNAIKKYYEAGI